MRDDQASIDNSKQKSTVFHAGRTPAGAEVKIHSVTSPFCKQIKVGGSQKVQVLCKLFKSQEHTMTFSKKLAAAVVAGEVQPDALKAYKIEELPMAAGLAEGNEVASKSIEKEGEAKEGASGGILRKGKKSKRSSSVPAGRKMRVKFAEGARTPAASDGEPVTKPQAQAEANANVKDVKPADPTEPAESADDGVGISANLGGWLDLQR